MAIHTIKCIRSGGMAMEKRMRRRAPAIVRQAGVDGYAEARRVLSARRGRVEFGSGRAGRATLSMAAAGANRVVERDSETGGGEATEFAVAGGTGLFIVAGADLHASAAGLDESVSTEAHELHGRFINLFDADLRVQKDIKIEPGTRWFLLDLDAPRNDEPRVLASACRTRCSGKTAQMRSILTWRVWKRPQENC